MIVSNRLCVQPTEFKNYKSNDVTLGYRIYDDYGQYYNNCWDSIPDNDFDILRKVLEDDSEALMDMIAFLQYNCEGLYIGDNYYEYEEVASILTET